MTKAAVAEVALAVVVVVAVSVVVLRCCCIKLLDLMRKLLGEFSGMSEGRTMCSAVAASGTGVAHQRI